ncbi:LamG domain-containing protein [Permianibacter sp. IMCC34836]|uniref:LamG domain-containing protein n=1 Tax=Permianibacter fluminis TaxID=2738515 RepID=UPI001557BFF6|nr:LamG domain-containing protein [Permianibacter fluminis]NQD37277.1 LamG domain-containing protein [Permianibacter fluminis]
MKNQVVVSTLRTLKPAVKSLFAAGLLAVLAACSGGGAGTEENVTTPPNPGGNYNGPPPASDDVQRFKINLWDNIVGTDKCGACHVAGGQSPEFARSDDINLAYAAANTVVNLTEPDKSRMVEKVGGGHNCWLGTAQAELNACAETLTRYITNWAGGSVGGGANEVKLDPPVEREPGNSRTFPSDTADFRDTVYPLLTEYCSRCHSDTADNAQSPYFASADINVAYAAVQSKINLDNVDASRLVVRLREESHNCWDNCTANAQEMQDAIQAFVDGIPLTEVDPNLVISRSMRLIDGVVASSGGRYEANVIGLYQFKEGSGSVAFDTSGVEPAAQLNLSGGAEFVGGWGVQFAGPMAKAQASTLSSKKYHDLIKATGEYSIEAWVAPANVTQDGPAHIVSYLGSADSTNFTLGQTLYNYDFLMRHSGTGADGNPALSTADADERLQATLQHVVVTYDPIRGRRIYVNGEFTGDVDNTPIGNLNDWDNTFAFVLGNSPALDRPWAGIIKLVAIHNRVLTDEQIVQNFNVGVGERYYLMFSVSHLLDNPACFLGTPAVSQCYLVVEVSRYDSYGYLFNKPFFVSLNDAATFNGIPFQGMRIGINGREAPVGQSYAKLDTTLTASNQVLSPLGTVIGLEKGPASDEFFLTFERIGTHTNVYLEPTPPPPGIPSDSNPESAIGVRTFDEINESLAEITTVSPNSSSIKTLFAQIRQALPSVETITAFNSAQQMAVTQLSIAYCSALVDDATKRASYFPGVNFAAGPTVALDATGRNNVINPLIAHVMASNVTSQPNVADVQTEMNALITRLAASGGNTSARTITIVKSVCAATVGNAAMLVQ